jgi:chromosome segregation ATPase
MAHEGTENSDAREPLGRKGARGADSLSSDMRTLTGVIRDLEEQLDRMIAANEALKADLEQEKKRRISAESKLDQLNERLTRSEQELAAKENVHGEVSQLHHERARLAASVRELGQKLEVAEREGKKQAESIARLRAARADAVEEVQSVESQFERSMQMVSHVKSQLAAVSEERDALAADARLLEEKLRQSERDRDALHAEVEQSRSALDEIRRSLVDAVVVPGGGRTGSRPGTPREQE